MKNYDVFLSTAAREDLDEIYNYISSTLKEPSTALKLVGLIENELLSLSQMPYRHPERNVGLYAGKGYRQLAVKNYTAIYRIEEDTRRVIIITVQYSKRNI